MAEESLETKLARIEEILIGYIKRLDERCFVRADTLMSLKKGQEDNDQRLTDLEHWKQQTKGGWMVLCVISTCSAAIGGLIVGIVTVYYSGKGSIP